MLNLEDVQANNNLFSAIKNLIELAVKTEDKNKAVRHMCRALLLISRSELTDRERDNLFYMIKENILREVL